MGQLILPQDAGSPPQNNVQWTLAIYLDAQHMFLLFSGKITWILGGEGVFSLSYVQSWWGCQRRYTALLWPIKLPLLDSELS